MAGVQRGKQVDDLGTAHLADDDAVGSHPQRLANQVAHGDLADPLDVGSAGDQLDQMRVARRQLGRILDAHDALVGGDRAQRGRQQRRLTRPGPARHQERQPGCDDLVQQSRRVLGDRSRPHQRGEVLAGRPKHPQRQAGARLRNGRQHRVQPDRERTETRELAVDPGLRIVEATADRQGQPLRESPHRCLVGEANHAGPQPRTVVHPHRVGGGDEHVGGAVGPQQRLQDAGTGQLGLHDAEFVEHLGVAEHAARLGSDGSRNDVGPQRECLTGQALADPLDTRRAHAAPTAD